MNKSVSQLAAIIGGQPVGDVNLRPDRLASIEDASADAICPYFRSGLMERAPVLPLAVLAPERLASKALEMGVAAVISHPEPSVGLARLIDVFHPEQDLGHRGFIHPSAVVDGAAHVHTTAWIGPGVVIEGDTEVGEGAWIGPNAVICAGTSIGRYARIGPCAVIGHEGFGFVPSAEGLVKIRQVGGVRIGDFAEIGAATCVDRATLGTTIVGDGAKIDNLVQIGHNARLGNDVLIASQAGLAGSTRIGDGAMLGGQVGVGDHVRVGARSRVAGQSGVTRDTEEGAVVMGTPAVDRIRWLKGMARLLSISEPGSGPDTEEN